MKQIFYLIIAVTAFANLFAGKRCEMVVVNNAKVGNVVHAAKQKVEEVKNGNCCEIVIDCNQMMSNIVNIAKQKVMELNNKEGLQNKLMLLSIEYKRYHTKMQLNEKAKRKLEQLNVRWIWIVSFGPFYKNKPKVVGGGYEIVIADSEEKEVVSVMRTK